MTPRFFGRPAILDGNRWTPADNELAVFFRFKDLSGIFTKVLHVPAGMKGWGLRGDDGQSVELLNEGEHTVETLFQRMNNFFRSAPGEVLIVRTDAVPLNFRFEPVMTAESLPLRVELSTQVRVRTGTDDRHPDVAAFRRKFMLRDGVVTTEGLEQLLQAPLRQLLQDFISAWRVQEADGNPDFRSKLEAELRNRLAPFLDDLGLELVALSKLAVCHERLDELKQLRGRLWLVRHEQATHDEHARALNDLYDARECGEIRLREQALRRSERAAELAGQEGDLAQRVRVRQVAEYDQVLQARNRAEALRLGAQDTLEALQSEYLDKRRQREQQALGAQFQADDEAAEWAYLQELARIRRDTLVREEIVRREQQLLLLQASQQAELAMQAARAQIEHARLLDDEQARRRGLAAGVEEEIKARLRAQQILDAEAAAKLDGIELGRELRRREQERLQRLEDAAVQQKIDRMGLDTDRARADEKLRTLGTLIDLDHQDELNKQRRDEEAADRALERTMLDRKQQHEHALQRGAQDIDRLSITGALPLQALVLLADNPDKTAALVKLATLEQHGTMSAEAIRASLGLPAAADPPASPVDELVRQRQADDRQWASGMLDRQQSQATEFMEAIKGAIGALRDVGVANASGRAPQVIMPSAPMMPPAAPEPPSAPASVLREAYVQCVQADCRALNRVGGRYCSACGRPMA